MNVTERALLMRKLIHLLWEAACQDDEERTGVAWSGLRHHQQCLPVPHEVIDQAQRRIERRRAA